VALLWGLFFLLFTLSSLVIVRNNRRCYRGAVIESDEKPAGVSCMHDDPERFEDYNV
jgi:hypothetical protein